MKLAKDRIAAADSRDVATGCTGADMSLTLLTGAFTRSIQIQRV